MKKTKRIVAFVLVLAFVFAFMAMSASAATARGAVCDNCGSASTKFTNHEYLQNKTVSGCASVQGYHVHRMTITYTLFTCNSCGNTVRYNYSESFHSCMG